MRVLLLLVLLAACGGGGGARGATRHPIGLVLPATDGGEIDIVDHRTKAVVLHVFTTWSLAATGDVPQLLEAAKRDDVTVIGIALDLEGYTVVAPWRRALGVTYLVALATDSFRAGGSALGDVGAVPVTIVLDRRGRIAQRIDRQLTDGELARVIGEVLSSPP
jgi:peroxiredoxin